MLPEGGARERLESAAAQPMSPPSPPPPPMLQLLLDDRDDEERNRKMSSGDAKTARGAEEEVFKSEAAEERGTEFPALVTAPPLPAADAF